MNADAECKMIVDCVDWVVDFERRRCLCKVTATQKSFYWRIRVFKPSYSNAATSVSLGANALCSHSASGRGAICARALASELADVLRLIIESSRAHKCKKASLPAC